LNTEMAGNIAVLAARRERLAIVSTFDKLCGIAAYTHALERQLADVFDVTIFDLDQDLLRSRHRGVRRLADRHIRDICAAIGSFDAVNIQFEYGTLGRRAKDIVRRFRWLVTAAPRLSVTFHTFNRPAGPQVLDLLSTLLQGKVRHAVEAIAAWRRNRILSLRVTSALRRAQARKIVAAIVHTRRDAFEARHLNRLDRVIDHPLAFLSAAEADAIARRTTRRQFPLLDDLPSEAKLVGVFGFISDYKGFGTVIRALHHLPESYHLLIFGGTHPNEIQPHRAIHPNIASLLRDGHVDATLYEQILTNSGPPRIGLALDAERQLSDLLSIHPRDLSNRIHFMGAPDDDEFLGGMAICDVAVFPYLEVGQSSSGPISQALELGCRVVASRTRTFLQLAKYHPNRIEFFDIGNHLELAGRIASRPQYAERTAPRYNVETNKLVYLTANSAIPNATSWRPSRRQAAKPRRSATRPD